MEKQVIIVDSDVIIDFFNGKSSLLKMYLKQQNNNQIELVISVITLYEFYSGKSLNNQEILLQSDTFFKFFSIQTITLEIAQLGAELNRKHQLYGKIGLGDLLIGTSSLYLKAKLLTKNKRHFSLIPGIIFAK